MKTNINLYQASCYLQKPKASWDQMLLCLSFSIVCMIFLKFYLDNKSDQLQQSSQEIKFLIVTKQEDLSSLSIKLVKQQMPIQKVQEVLELEKQIEFYQNISQNRSLEHKNYSIVMNELFLSKTDSINIKNFVIRNGKLDISGNALNSNSVPLWLLNMQSKKLLSEHSFDNFTLSGSDGHFRLNLQNKKAD